MSTDLQDLSIDLQKQAIAAYARSADLQIVATYEDAGKSGLSIRRREGMKRLVREVTAPNCPFGKVLVYDVSRWGRFQDTDASAYWEYHCQMHGVEVIYVAEAFESHTGPIGALIKNLKRAMAAEYSRELAVKVRAGQERVIAMGYSAGGQPAIGLARLAVSRDGQPRTVLRPGERKAVQSDRIKLVPGPAEEVALVRYIFELYANTPITVAALQRRLLAEGHRTNRGKTLTIDTLHALLRYEPFVGNYVWAKRIDTPKGPMRRPVAQQVRVEGAIAPLIDRDLWDRVQQKLNQRSRTKRTQEQLLKELEAALHKKPDLSGSDLGSLGCAIADTYTKAFGSMEGAYALAGRETTHATEAWGRQRTEASKVRAREVQLEVARAFAQQGQPVRCDLRSFMLITSSGLAVQLSLVWKRSFTREAAWLVRRRCHARCDWRLVILVAEEGTLAFMYCVPEAERYSFPMIIRDADLSELKRLRVITYAQAVQRVVGPDPRSEDQD
jgi:DNA invertase Pin-like site-specific DNA recombinase